MSKTLFIVLGALCFVAAGVMYYLGSNSSHISELKDFWYVPLPLGAVALMRAFSKRPQE